MTNTQTPTPADPTATPRELVTVEAAAVWAGVSARTVYRRIADGTLVAYTFGPKCTRVDRAELNAALTLRRVDLPKLSTDPLVVAGIVYQ
ncbi:DNA binding domain-containing protein, excisionase family [Nakamurella panacisegetis]|uniref:DNA binding domain-containing protein, excisionase family n=1 Tax=Nakamurella panacisegetis TaxID=1090615 RepID=A0A1H0Q1K6_9ACTN|nr:helix-turn-helix domain-containing protein [Nakamurella panacisegetis]SDP10885.1 DNA binding domain-containing protein, excisionase family [Nakamurella panacisegetis]